MSSSTSHLEVKDQQSDKLDMGACQAALLAPRRQFSPDDRFPLLQLCFTHLLTLPDQ
jgi:hypothetical protein